MESRKVLIVDDDVTVCGLLETVLKLEGYRTASASEIEDDDIIALLNSEKPHLLILDFHLGPTKETLGFVTAVRGNPDWEHLPILMTSAIDRRQECVEAGVDHFLLKPFDWQEMTKSVNRIRDEII